MAVKVAVVGPPNVGKSSLVNRLAGGRHALVADQPGMTRDRREIPVAVEAGELMLIDTGGWIAAEPSAARADQALADAMGAQTWEAVAEAAVIVLVVDARAAATTVDADFLAALRETGKPVIVAPNKAEGGNEASAWTVGAELGLGEVVPVSAVHGTGTGELLEAIELHLSPTDEAGTAEANQYGRGGDAMEGVAGDSEGQTPEALQIALVGRPNVGKSSLANALVGTERVIVGAWSGITRDAIPIEGALGGRTARFVDTAGLRRKARIGDGLEKLATGDSLRALNAAEVAVVIADATVGLEKQDLTLLGQVVDEGRAPVLALNKWDLIESPKQARRDIADRLRASFQQVPDLAVVPLSATTGYGLRDLAKAVERIYAVWNQRVATGELNRWLEAALIDHPPSLAQGRRLKIRFTTQVGTRPPTFVFWINRPEDLPIVYKRYLHNRLRDAFGFHGVPVRLYFRKPDNPYAPD